MVARAEHFFIAGAVAVVLTGYVWSTLTAKVDPVQWQDGDLIVQRSNDIPVLPVFGNQEEPPVHIGVVHMTQDGPLVIESTQTVTETPLAEFVNRGTEALFAVYRMKTLTKAQSGLVIAAARSKLGAPADFFLDEAPDHLYSSELARLAFNAAGIGLGKTDRLGDLAKSNSAAVSNSFTGRWMQSKPCQRRYLSYEQCWQVVARYEVISPMSLVADERMTKIYASPGVETEVAVQENPAAPAS